MATAFDPNAQAKLALLSAPFGGALGDGQIMPLNTMAGKGSMFWNLGGLPPLPSGDTYDAQGNSVQGSDSIKAESAAAQALLASKLDTAGQDAQDQLLKTGSLQSAPQGKYGAPGADWAMSGFRLPAIAPEGVGNNPLATPAGRNNATGMTAFPQLAQHPAPQLNPEYGQPMGPVKTGPGGGPLLQTPEERLLDRGMMRTPSGALTPDSQGIQRTPGGSMGVVTAPADAGLFSDMKARLAATDAQRQGLVSTHAALGGMNNLSPEQRLLFANYNAFAPQQGAGGQAGPPQMNQQQQIAINPQSAKLGAEIDSEKQRAGAAVTQANALAQNAQTDAAKETREREAMTLAGQNAPYQAWLASPDPNKGSYEHWGQLNMPGMPLPPPPWMRGQPNPQQPANGGPNAPPQNPPQNVVSALLGTNDQKSNAPLDDATKNAIEVAINTNKGKTPETIAALASLTQLQNNPDAMQYAAQFGAKNGLTTDELSKAALEYNENGFGAAGSNPFSSAVAGIAGRFGRFGPFGGGPTPNELQHLEVIRKLSEAQGGRLPPQIGPWYYKGENNPGVVGASKAAIAAMTQEQKDKLLGRSKSTPKNSGTSPAVATRERPSVPKE